MATGRLITDEDAIYSIGDNIEIVLTTDIDVGDTINVTIYDRYKNPVAVLLASKIFDLTYSLEWKIPLGLKGLYNINKEEDTDSEYFHLKDEWEIGTSILSFNFKVVKFIEDPLEDNSSIQINLNGIKSKENSVLKDTTIVFTTAMNPFYCTIDDVLSTNYSILSTISPMAIALDIYNLSKIVDYHIKPSNIIREESFDLAVNNYVRLSVAIKNIETFYNLSHEEKMLDTFKIVRTYRDIKSILDSLIKDRNKFLNIISAGGLLTPYVSRTFIKSLYDINREVLGRKFIDMYGSAPYTNTTTKTLNTIINGNDVEIIGTRTTSCNYFNLFDLYDFEIGNEIGY